MQGLAQAVLPAFQQPGSAPGLFLDAIALALHAHVVYAYGGLLGGGSSVRTGLAPWQLRRACEFIEANLAGDPSIADLARECRLSASHFARGFSPGDRYAATSMADEAASRTCKGAAARARRGPRAGRARLWVRRSKPPDPNLRKTRRP